jgi:3-deoxy-D-manno-octulosonic-acid transferase
LVYNTRYLLPYQIASTAAGLLGWPFFYWHLRSRGRRDSFLPRLGLALPPGPPPSGSPRIWLHGVSVGEILAALPLAQELKRLLPQCALIVSTGTETGQLVARQHFGPLGACVCYFPLDLPWAVYRYLRYLRPQVFVGLDSEIWPNFLATAHRLGVRLALANARLSLKSFRRLLKYRRYLIDIIELYDVIGAGSQEAFDRFRSLNLSPGKLTLTGNLKYDRLLQGRNPERVAGLQQLLFPAGGMEAPVFLAASTHPGEEEAVSDAYQALLTPYPALLLLLAPRHPERAPELARRLAARGLPCQLFSRLKSGAASRNLPVVIIDTIGDLFHLYALADVAFVGGSLVPHGGQNILESAAWGRAPLYGPHLDNFRWAETILTDAGAGLMVADAPSLAREARKLLDCPAYRQRLGSLAQAALIPHQGAARRQAELIVQLTRGRP